MPQKDGHVGIFHNRPRNVYHQNSQIRFMCLVCLTRSNTMMYDLSENSVLFEENLLDTNVVSIHGALEKVTSSKVRNYLYFKIYFTPTIICFFLD